MGKLIERYQPPAPATLATAGDSDHADPNFKPRLRDCGKCSRPFETTPRWRYFCPKCRATVNVQKGLSQTFSINRTRGG